MKINCNCGHIIIDNTDYLRHKGYVISDTQWFDFWDAIDHAIEKTGNSPKEKERACMQLRKKNVFKPFWECTNCGKLYVDDKAGNLRAYSPENKTYNKVLDKKV